MSLTDPLSETDRPGTASGIVTKILKEPVKEAVAEVLAENPELGPKRRDYPSYDSSDGDTTESSGSRGHSGSLSTLIRGGILLGLAVVFVLALREMRSSDGGRSQDEDHGIESDSPSSSALDESGPASVTTSATHADSSKTVTSDEPDSVAGSGDDDSSIGESPKKEENEHESTDDGVGPQSSSSPSS